MWHSSEKGDGKLSSRQVRNLILQLDRMNLAVVEQEYISKIVSDLLIGYVSKPSTLDQTGHVFRVVKPERFPITSISELSYPPANRVHKYGRGNYPNQSVFYCATGPTVALAETDSKVGEWVLISRWTVTGELNLNHIGYTEELTAILQSSRKLEDAYEFVKKTKNYSELNEMVYEYLGLIFSSTFEDIELQAQFKRTSAIAQILLTPPFEGLAYPTRKLNGSGDNIIIRTDVMDKKIQFADAIYGKLKSINGAKYVMEPGYSIGVFLPSIGEIYWKDTKGAPMTHNAYFSEHN